MLKNKVLWLFLMSLCCLNIFGQQKEITKVQFFDTRTEALKKVDAYNRRVTKKTEDFSRWDGSLQNSYVSISEKILPYTTRSVSIQTIKGVTKKQEEIKFGAFLYERTDDGKWTKTDLRNFGGLIEKNGCIIADNEYYNKVKNNYTMAENSLNGQQTMFYEGLTTVRSLDDSITFSRNRFWINKDGLILKSESESGSLNPETIYSKSITDYEYNPKDLKIKAPIK